MRQSLILVFHTLASLAMVAAFFTTTALGQLPIRFTVDGDSAGDRLGQSVSGAGDVNGDGFDDIIVGAAFDDNNGFSSGSARVYSGFDGAILYTFDGDSSDDRLGYSVSGAGDVNGDGFADLIAGAPADDNNGSASGSARVYSGFDGAILYTFNGDSAFDQLGFSVSGAGDVNGDGFGDIIAGAWSDDNNGSDSGSARVYSGFDGAILYTFNGDSGSDILGFSVSGAGDVNGDSFDDIIAGAQGDDNNGFDSGSARVYSGFDGAILCTFNGDAAGDQLGSSVSGAGDVNGDGFGDIIAGARSDDNNGSNSGSVRVYSGFDGAILFTFNGDSADDQLGLSASGAGDVNGDGFDDIITGARGDDNNGLSSGSARVYSGFDGAILFTFNGDSFGDILGDSVSGAGDVNGDGFADVIAGAWRDDNNGLDSGSARVFSVCGQQPYGLGIDPAQTLTFEWRSFSGGTDAANGELLVGGSAPFNTGIFALSTQPTMTSMLGFTLLVDITPSNSFTENFVYDATGQLIAPLSLRQPVIAGLTFFLQVVEANPAAPMGVFSSNGVELLFCN